jgi:hypothetical protein
MDRKDVQIKALTQMLRQARDELLQYEFDARVEAMMAAQNAPKPPTPPVDGLPDAGAVKTPDSPPGPA